MRSWKTWLAVVVIFLGGAVAGISAVVLVAHHKLAAFHAGGPLAFERLLVYLVDWRVDLTPEQQTGVARVLRDAHIDLLRFHARHHDEVEQIVEPALGRVEALLVPEQHAAWASIETAVRRHVQQIVEAGQGK